MKTKAKHVVVTGAGGQIAYSLLFRLANGDFLGPEQPLALHLLEIPTALGALEGVRMELEDCAFPLLKSITVDSDPKKAFRDADFALLVGATPRGPGMERSDLLQENAKIFIEQGKALEEVASRDVKVLVVGNPCNTNCWIAMHQAPSLSRKNFFAMTRLDQNRAQGFLARQSGVPVEAVKNVVIWGNHSATQVPDFFHATILGHPVNEIIQDLSWLEGEFSSLVQKRGAAVIQARGKSSAASAAHAILGAMRDVVLASSAENWFSMAVCSDHNAYGITEDLIFSFPCINPHGASPKIVEKLSLNSFLREALARTEKELMEEREMVKHLVK